MSDRQGEHACIFHDTIGKPEDHVGRREKKKEEETERVTVSTMALSNTAAVRPVRASPKVRVKERARKVSQVKTHASKAKEATIVQGAR